MAMSSRVNSTRLQSRHFVSDTDAAENAPVTTIDETTATSLLEVNRRGNKGRKGKEGEDEGEAALWIVLSHP